MQISHQPYHSNHKIMDTMNKINIYNNSRLSLKRTAKLLQTAPKTEFISVLPPKQSNNFNKSNSRQRVENTFYN